jgi:hypothetical protein
MKFLITFIISFFFSISIYSQINYGTPNEKDIPENLQKLDQKIIVKNYPKIINPIKIKNRYYWKHNTLIFSKDSKIKIIEFGAYLYYNNKWNLRKKYSLKDFNKNFGTKKQVLLKAQPYTWNNNWRTSSKLFGGWAMWYFIGLTENGNTVCGYEMIHTTNNLMK